MSNKKRITKICPVCKQEFETGGRAGRRTKIFCSNRCSFLARYRHGSICNKLNKIDCAYIAGFIDGEGSIIIYKRREDSYGMRITITQAEKGLWILEWIQEITSVGSITHKIRESILHAPCHQWACNSEAAETLLKQILPYLKLKREQAELALSFQGKLREPELKADRDWQINFRQTMQALNMRGCTSEA